ncbi:MAG: hypothetical protein AAGU21_01655 [Solidesulfovibrio sp.]|jgi:hypothetical protein|nr:hypothetical protein [Solidesulfovibrio sp.]MEA4857864.1 hypothetical protein [Solidesulfovibrio sp.]
MDVGLWDANGKLPLAGHRKLPSTFFHKKARANPGLAFNKARPAA